MNKKAALGPQSMVYLFLIIIIIIGTGLAIGVGAFFSADYDFREVDATILAETITECISEKDISFNSQSKFESDFYEKCNLNKKAIENSFYIYISVNEQDFYKIGIGDKTQCALGEDNDQFMKCLSTNIEKENKRIFIQTGTNQKGRKLPTASFTGDGGGEFGGGGASGQF